MAEVFKASPLISQSGDNTKVKITDNSNYATNTEGIDPGDILTRSVAITDANGDAVATLPLVLDSDNKYSVEYPIAKDLYYTYVLTLTLAGPVTKVGTTNYVTVGYYNTAFANVMKNNLSDCGCKKGNVCSDLTWSMHNKNAAIIFASKGMALLSQQSIDAANSFVNNILNG